MKTRVTTAIIGIVFCLVLLIVSGFSFAVAQVVISLASGLCFYEYLSSNGLEKNLVYLILGLFVAVASPFLANTSVVFLPLCLAVIAGAVITIVKHDLVNTEEMFFILSGIVLIVLPMTAFGHLVTVSEKAPFWLVLVLAIPWVADSAAYFAGNAIGKKKLCPEISPKKTVEGAVVGVLAGILSSLLIYVIFQYIFYRSADINFGIVLLIGIFCSVISIVGDLSFSLVKRHTGIKDFGFILPGHGGLLDRLDSVMFCIPVVYLFAQITTVIA